ncbi:MAG: hypothetical protein IPH04_15485 [Saprospirales bacterium]|nr:hypothetical protein [Saprospirales bacterium]
MKKHNPFSRSLYWLSGLVLTAALVSSCDSCQQADISVTSMEITQGIQTSTNTVDFVANRSTAVRVFVTSNGAGDVPWVGGMLTVTVDGTEITPAGGLAPIGPTTAVDTPSRNLEGNALVFELPGPNGITESSDVDFEVTVSYSNDPDETNNTFRVDNLNFEQRETPTLLFTRVDYTPSGLGLSPLADVQAGMGDLFVRGIYPVRDGDSDLYNESTLPTIAFSNDQFSNDTIDGNDGSDLLGVLSTLRFLEVFFSGHPNNSTFIYGWVNGNPISGNGLGSVGGFQAFGNTDLTRHQRTLAHELGHNFGLNHNSRTITPDVGWDVGARLENNPAANNTTGRIKATTMNDIMVGGQLTNSAWVDVTTYSFFESSSSILGASPMMAEGQAGNVLAVQGYFDPQGQTLLSLKPSLRLDGKIDPPKTPDAAPFSLVITNDKGKKQSIPFNAQVCWDREDNELEYGFFEVLVPIPADMKIKSIDVLNQSGEKMGGLASSAPPKVKIVAPAAGAKLEAGKVQIEWTVQDSDTKPESLLFHLAFSSDGGETWGPVGIHIVGNKYELDTAQLKLKKTENGMLRLYACDGLNTVIAEVDKLSL